MTNTTKTTTPATGLLTQKELFRLFLDAPLREGTASTLISPQVSSRTISESMEKREVPTALSGHRTLQEVLEGIANDAANPKGELLKLLVQLGFLQAAVEEISKDFDELVEKLRGQRPDDDASLTEWEEWKQENQLLDPRPTNRAAQ